MEICTILSQFFWIVSAESRGFSTKLYFAHEQCNYKLFQIIFFSVAINNDSKHSRYKEPLQYERQRSVTVMSERLSLVTCTSCGKPIPPGSESTKFLCPNCGEIQIKRDGKCRKFGRLYKCPKCGFSGP
jgi:predicted RNA-binding Zn-ribbon protein involved in translation (DUF1610 family)